MCGIIGYIGSKPAVDVLVDGLRKMEYRGYDSAGIAVFGADGLKIVKSVGRLENLEKKLEAVKDKGVCGIGHTRWATHGEPSLANTHPHTSKRVTVVHNGIIENYIALREALLKKGYTFFSETDTEVAAHLIDSYFEGDLHKAVRAALKDIKGAYAFGVIDNEDPTKIVAARKDSPLLVGIGQGENYIASDMPAILKYTKDYYVLEEGDIAEITANSVTVWDENDVIVQKKLHHAEWSVDDAEKNGYKHFMLKEIHETPSVLRRITEKYVEDNEIRFDGMAELNRILNKTKRMVIVACGSARYVGEAAKYFVEAECGVEVAVEAASEFRYRNPVLREGDLVIAISQSGETADTLAAIRLAKLRGYPVLGIVNVPGSSIAREADAVIYTEAGPEIAVATTKAFTAQLAVVLLLALQLGVISARFTPARASEYLNEFKTVPILCEDVLEKEEVLKDVAGFLATAENVFFIGRGIDYAVSLEGALKLKEITYIHSEAFSAGELKHGPISLVDANSPTVALATQRHLIDKMISNIREVESRKGKTVVLCMENDAKRFSSTEKIVVLPNCNDAFAPVVCALALQMIAYFAADIKGCDVDKPRNLAKSVTVE